MVLTRLILGNSLPEITATHWSESRYPDGFTMTSVFFTASVTVTLLGAVLGQAALGLRRKPVALLGLLFVGSLAAWTMFGVFLSSAVPTALAGDPTQAVSGGWIFAAMLTPLIGLAPLWICGVFQQNSKYSRDKRKARIAAAQGHTPVQKPALTTAEMNQDFNETMSGPWLIWVVAAVIIGAGVFALSSSDTGSGATDWITLIIGFAMIVVVTPVVLGLAKIRVTVRNDKLRVSSAIFGFPLKTIDISEIATVTSEEIIPMEWGGWGWRFFPGGSAVVMRQFEGLAVELKDQRRFAVTIGDSQRAATKLNALMKRGA
ncbi:DUF3093 family protein [Glutamicibacter sp.]|uniref:DUF3093 family protein n=1 Tax=Glutamicibacter sp. TaxID=1931995 RepID=UPI0028BF3822|nr:DUF3093 family protein [Glutamicibacter sp.]